MNEFRQVHEATIEAASRLVIYGHSDDVFGFEVFLDEERVRGGDEHDDCARGLIRRLTLTAPDGSGVVVRGRYAEGGVWEMAIAPLDEDHEYAGGVSVTFEGYTPHVCIEAPEGGEVRLEVEDR